MKSVLIGIVVLLVAIVALGYFQGWFGVKKEDGKVKVVTDPAKFKQDRAAFSKLIAEKARAGKNKVAMGVTCQLKRSHGVSSCTLDSTRSIRTPSLSLSVGTGI